MCACVFPLGYPLSGCFERGTKGTPPTLTVSLSRVLRQAYNAERWGNASGGVDADLHTKIWGAKQVPTGRMRTALGTLIGFGGHFL